MNGTQHERIQTEKKTICMKVLMWQDPINEKRAQHYEFIHGSVISNTIYIFFMSNHFKLDREVKW